MTDQFYYRGKNLHVSRGGPEIVAYVTMGVGKRLTVRFDPGPTRVPGHGHYTFMLNDHDQTAHAQVYQKEWENQKDRGIIRKVMQDLELQLLEERLVQFELDEAVENAGLFVKAMVEHNVGKAVDRDGRKRGEDERDEPGAEG